MGEKSRAKWRRRVEALLHKVERAQRDKVEAQRSGRRKAAIGVGVQLVSPVWPYIGLPPEVVPLSVLVGMAIIIWAIRDLPSVHDWLAASSRRVRFGIHALMVIAVFGLMVSVWVLVGRSVKGVQLGGYPKFNRTEELSAVSPGGACPSCQNEIDVDGVATLTIVDAGRGYLQLGVRGLDDPLPIELNNPLPGNVPVPASGSTENSSATPAQQPFPGPAANAAPGGNTTSSVGVYGTIVDGKPVIGGITVPDEFRGNLVITRPPRTTIRFDIAALQPQNVVAGERTFVVRVTRYREASTPDRRHTMFHYRLRLAEQ